MDPRKVTTFFFPNAISYIYISLGCSEEMKKQNIRERERKREREQT